MTKKHTYTDECPICGEIRVDEVCAWENVSPEAVTQAVALDEMGHGVDWSEAVLKHEAGKCRDCIHWNGFRWGCELPNPRC